MIETHKQEQIMSKELPIKLGDKLHLTSIDDLFKFECVVEVVECDLPPSEYGNIGLAMRIESMINFAYEEATPVSDYMIYLLDNRCEPEPITVLHHDILELHSFEFTLQFKWEKVFYGSE